MSFYIREKSESRLELNWQLESFLRARGFTVYTDSPAFDLLSLKDERLNMNDGPDDDSQN